MANYYITVQDYSEALEQLISSVFKAGSVIYSPLPLVWEQYTKQKDNRITLPFISFFPGTEYELDLENTSQPDYNLGNLPRFVDKDTQSRKQSIKMDLTYYFEIVAQDRIQAESILTELVFWFQKNQQISVAKGDEQYDFTFLINPTITDNSNYDNYKEENMLYRFTIPINAEIYLFRSRLFKTAKRTIIDIKEVNHVNN